jgi:hypothetical protein
LNDLDFKKKWEFLNQYAGSSLNLMVNTHNILNYNIRTSRAIILNQKLIFLFFQRTDPAPVPVSNSKLKNAKSNRALVTVREEYDETRESDPSSNNNNNTKDKKSRTKSVRTLKNSILFPIRN